MSMVNAQCDHPDRRASLPELWIEGWLQAARRDWRPMASLNRGRF
jgi:hypothetical protein